MNVYQKIEKFVKEVFKTSLVIFYEALKLSPNAQGYVGGSIAELLLKDHLEQQGFEVKRIKEKWEGRKHRHHQGDFYFRKIGKKWFVMECKGVKSNSEKWHNLYNRDRLLKFLYCHHEIIQWVNKNKAIEPQIINWINRNLPKFQEEYKDTLYNHEEIQKYNFPKKENKKSKAIAMLRNLTREEITAKIDERLLYVKSKIKVLETHFVSGKSELNDRTQATPRKDEFNIVAVDIYLRYPEHRFLFAHPGQLDSSTSDADHLQQNYVFGFLFPNEDGTGQLNLSDEWHEDMASAYSLLREENAIKESDMQEDKRNLLMSKI